DRGARARGGGRVRARALWRRRPRRRAWTGRRGRESVPGVQARAVRRRAPRRPRAATRRARGGGRVSAPSRVGAPLRALISRRMPLARFLYTDLAGYRRLLGVGIVMTIVQVFSELAVAFPLKFILDKVINHRNPSFPFADTLIRPFDHLGSAASLAP